VRRDERGDQDVDVRDGLSGAALSLHALLGTQGVELLVGRYCRSASSTISLSVFLAATAATLVASRRSSSR